MKALQLLCLQSTKYKYLSYCSAECSGEASCQRFRKARCDYLKFESFLLQITKRNPTGSPTDEDTRIAALAVYR